MAETKLVTTYQLPDVALLSLQNTTATESDESQTQARQIEQTLASFGAPANVRQIHTGPTLTRFALEPGPRVRASSIARLADEIALRLAVPNVRVETSIAGLGLVGVEVANRQRQTVTLRSLLESETFQQYSGLLKLALGRGVDGTPIVTDLTQMPHLLIAGSTNSGKSVCLNSIIASLLFQYSPHQLRLVLIDPKRVELTGFDGLPHLLFPVITDVGLPLPNHEAEKETTTVTVNSALAVLVWLVEEMERRYKLLEIAGQRNITAYNRYQDKNEQEKLAFIVVATDELADLMLQAGQLCEELIVRLAQKARAVGIHLIFATQRPSVDVITGLIKANISARIAFAVASQADSRVILDGAGAERLLGSGDMLIKSAGGITERAQGVYLSDGELTALQDWWRNQNPYPLVWQPHSDEPTAGLDKNRSLTRSRTNSAKAVTIAPLILQQPEPVTIKVQDGPASVEVSRLMAENEMLRLENQRLLAELNRIKISEGQSSAPAMSSIVQGQTLQIAQAHVGQLLVAATGKGVEPPKQTSHQEGATQAVERLGHVLGLARSFAANTSTLDGPTTQPAVERAEASKKNQPLTASAPQHFEDLPPVLQKMLQGLARRCRTQAKGRQYELTQIALILEHAPLEMSLSRIAAYLGLDVKSIISRPPQVGVSSGLLNRHRAGGYWVYTSNFYALIDQLLPAPVDDAAKLVARNWLINQLRKPLR